MSSDVPEVRDILKEMTRHIKSCNEGFSEQNISNALYGLHNMSSDVPEVRDILKEMRRQIK